MRTKSRVPDFPSQIREPPALYWVPFLLCLQTLHHEHSVWSKWHLCLPPFKDPLSKQPFEKCMLLSCERLLCSSYGPLGGEGRHCSPDISGKFPVTWHLFYLPKSCWEGRVRIPHSVSWGRKRISSSNTSLRQRFFMSNLLERSQNFMQISLRKCFMNRFMLGHESHMINSNF